MKTILLTLTFVLGVLVLGKSQTLSAQQGNKPVWTESERKYLLDNLIRTQRELIAETKTLSRKQWNFKESPDRWSINQIVEHLDRYELILMHEISVSYQIGPIPDFPQHLSDSLFADRDPNSLKKFNTTDYTKPFTISVPLGINEGEGNMTWFNAMRNESIAFVKATDLNIRQYYINFGPDMHQQYMTIFRHTERHLRQIRKVKAHPNYPK